MVAARRHGNRGPRGPGPGATCHIDRIRLPATGHLSCSATRQGPHPTTAFPTRGDLSCSDLCGRDLCGCQGHGRCPFSVASVLGAARLRLLAPGGRAPRALAARALRQSPAAASPPTTRFANLKERRVRLCGSCVCRAARRSPPSPHLLSGPSHRPASALLPPRLLHRRLPASADPEQMPALCSTCAQDGRAAIPLRARVYLTCAAGGAAGGRRNHPRGRPSRLPGPGGAQPPRALAVPALRQPERSGAYASAPAFVGRPTRCPPPPHSPSGSSPALCPPCCPRVSCAVVCAHVLLPRGVRDVPDPVSDEEVFLSPSRRLPAGAVSRRRALRSCRVVRPRPASPRPAALCCSSALCRPWPLPPSRPPQKTRRSRSSVGRLCARRQGFISWVVSYRMPTP